MDAVVHEVGKCDIFLSVQYTSFEHTLFEVECLSMKRFLRDQPRTAGEFYDTAMSRMNPC